MEISKCSMQWQNDATEAYFVIRSDLQNIKTVNKTM